MKISSMNDVTPQVGKIVAPVNVLLAISLIVNYIKKAVENFYFYQKRAALVRVKPGASCSLQVQYECN